MLTPAEIIAARYSAEPEDVSPIAIEPVVEETTQKSQSLNQSSRKISDESAFPALGGGSTISSTPSWGPGSSGNGQTSNTTSSGSGSNSSGFSHTLGNGAKTSSPSSSRSNSNSGMKFSTIQDAFSLSVEDQLQVTRPEFIKLLTSIKTSTKTNIECTTSQHTKKRTFLITGKPEDVRLAKRLVVKKLTRPVKITFLIPANVRSKVIGAQGRVLKPIVKENDVNVDIGEVSEREETPESNENSEDIVDEDNDDSEEMVQITISGDVEGCKHAKAQILAIVKEETKNLTTRVPISDFVKPFATSSLNSIVSDYPNLDIIIPDYKSNASSIIISGAREEVLESKKLILKKLSDVEASLSVVEVPIPKLKHQFLPIDEILENFNVLIKLSQTNDDAPVQFIGPKGKIGAAQEQARKTTSQYKVEVLEMSKAHRGNIAHVKSVAAFLTSEGTFRRIGKEHNVVVNAPTKKHLESEEALIPIEIVVKSDDADSAKLVRKSIVSVVNKISPDSTRIIDDIEEFLIPRVPSAIESVSKENKVKFVILGNKVTLFQDEGIEGNDESDDFDDFSDDSIASFDAVNKALDSLRELGKTLDSKIIKLTSEESDLILGSNRTTLKVILSHVEPDSVIVKESEDKIVLHGTKAEVLAVEKEIRTALADFKEFGSEYSTSIGFPTFILSRFIGRNGSNLNALQKEFGVKIDVESKAGETNAAEDKTSKTPILVIGTKSNVESCQEKIVDFAKRWADETLVRLRIEEQYHRKIIGANGIYINRLQDKYHVKIRFPAVNGEPSKFADAPKSKDEVTIKGPSRGVAKAEEELKELYQFEKENGFQQTIKIPSKAISRVIGRAGETIKDISDGTGVEYKFDREGDEVALGYVELLLTGSRAALKNAVEKINEIVQEAENFVEQTISIDRKHHRHLIGPGGSVMREIISKAGGDDVQRNKYNRLLTIPDEKSGSDDIQLRGDKSIVDKIVEQIQAIVARREASVIEEYDLVKEKHRLIIGPGGSIRQGLVEKYGVSIDVPKSGSESTIVKLEGLPEDVSKLRVELDELTKDDWNVEIEIPEKYHPLVSERGVVFNVLKSQYNVEVQHGPTNARASKLSKSKIPTIPEEAQAEGNKFTIVNGVELPEGSKIIFWRLKGTEADTAKAKKYIESRLKIAEAATATGWFYFQDPSVLPKIIGPRGSKLNQIRKNSGCFITAPRQGEQSENVLYLVGSEDGLAIAKKEIELIVKK